MGRSDCCDNDERVDPEVDKDFNQTFHKLPALLAVRLQDPDFKGKNGSNHEDGDESHQVLQACRSECREVHPEM